MATNLRNIGATSAMTCVDYDAAGGAGKRRGKWIVAVVPAVALVTRIRARKRPRVCGQA